MLGGATFAAQDATIDADVERAAALSRDAETREEGLEILSSIAGELFHRRLEGERDLDASFAGAVLALALVGAPPSPELPRADLCLAALDATEEGRRPFTAPAFASYLYALGDVEAAIECFEIGLASPGDPPQRSLLWTGLAQVQRRSGRWDDGLSALDEALALARESPSESRDFLLAYAYGERAQNLIDQGALDPARAALEAERDAAERSGDAGRELDAFRHELDHLLVECSFDEAYREVARFTKSEDFDGLDPTTQALFITMGGAALGGSGQRFGQHGGRAFLAKAEEWLGRADALGALGAFEAVRLDLFRAEFALAAEQDDDARAHLARARQRVRTVSAATGGLELDAHRLALEVLVDRGGERNAALDAEFRAAFDAFLDSWNETLRDGAGAYLRSAPRREILGRRIELSIGAGDQTGRHRAFTDLLQVQSRGSLAREDNVGAPTIEAIRSTLLSKGHGVIVFASAPSGGHVFALDDELTHAPLPDERDIWPSCRDLRREIDQASNSRTIEPEKARELDALVARTSELLLPDKIARRIKSWSRVSVVGMEFFFDIPFELLHDTDGRSLGETKAIDRLPSLPVAMALAARAVPRLADGMQAIVALNPSEKVRAAHGIAPIRPKSSDIERLTRPFDELARTLRGVSAETFSKTPLDRSAVHLILSHGVYESSSDQAGAALVLEGKGGHDGIVRRSDIAKRQMRGIVLLAACEAGRGMSRWGDDRLASLGGQVLEVGAICVIQTSARIPYGTALDFMEVVLDNLADGVAPAEAARRARVAVAKGDDPLGALRGALISVVGLGQRGLSD